MGLLDDAKKLAEQHEDVANGGIDKAAKLVEGKTPDQYDAKVAEVAAKSKDSLDKND